MASQEDVNPNEHRFRWVDYSGKPRKPPFDWEQTFKVLKFDQNIVYWTEEVDEEWVVVKRSRS